MLHLSFSFSTTLRAALVVGMVFATVACGSESQQTEMTEATETMSPDTIEVTMTDFAYTPDTLTVPAGKEVTLAFTNTGTVEHYFVVGDTIAGSEDGFEQNLFGGVSIEKSKQTEGHDQEEEEEHEEEEGGHENVFELPPEGGGSMTFTLPASKAGTYTIACFETTGGKKHYQMGMEGTLRVTASME